MATRTVKVLIGRTSGPPNDHEVGSELFDHEVDLFKDVIAMVNKVSEDKERWWVEIDGERTIPISNPPLS